MRTLAYGLAGTAAVVHVAVFSLESLAWPCGRAPSSGRHRSAPRSPEPAYNQGFYTCSSPSYCSSDRRVTAGPDDGRCLSSGSADVPAALVLVRYRLRLRTRDNRVVAPGSRGRPARAGAGEIAVPSTYRVGDLDTPSPVRGASAAPRLTARDRHRSSRHRKWPTHQHLRGRHWRCPRTETLWAQYVH